MKGEKGSAAVNQMFLSCIFFHSLNSQNEIREGNVTSLRLNYLEYQKNEGNKN